MVRHIIFDGGPLKSVIISEFIVSHFGVILMSSFLQKCYIYPMTDTSGCLPEILMRTQPKLRPVEQLQYSGESEPNLMWLPKEVRVSRYG